ncbi:BCCT family transporter [Candidatus Bipolaricaulota bacterium]|nr:BCCT family transporter [Candidatus Bipolaricaulota bacterium]
MAKEERSYDPYILWFSAILIAGFVLWSIIFPTHMETVVQQVFNWMTTSWVWLWLWTAFILVCAAFVMLVTDYGKMKLGKEGDSSTRYFRVRRSIRRAGTLRLRGS